MKDQENSGGKIAYSNKMLKLTRQIKEAWGGGRQWISSRKDGKHAGQFIKSRRAATLGQFAGAVAGTAGAAANVSGRMEDGAETSQLARITKLNGGIFSVPPTQLPKLHCFCKFEAEAAANVDLFIQ